MKVDWIHYFKCINIVCVCVFLKDCVLPLKCCWRNKKKEKKNRNKYLVENLRKSRRYNKLGKPQFTPVLYLRCLSYSHSLTCCPLFLVKHMRYSASVTAGTHWFNKVPVSVCGIMSVFVILWSGMIQHNSESAYCIFTYMKRTFDLCTHSFGVLL